MSYKLSVLVSLSLFAGGCAAMAQDAAQQPGYMNHPLVPGTQWHVHDMRRPQPVEVIPNGPVTTPPPADAIVLFDGSSLDAFVSGKGETPDWLIEDGVMTVNTGEPNGGGLRTREAFGDMQLHIEWRAPDDDKIDPVPQRAGNSGIYIMGRYEVQIQHSYRNPTYPDGQAGAVYGQSPPLVNASLPNGEWQSFDLVWEAPDFSESGELVEPAYVTVFHNGVLVQNRTMLHGPTGHKSSKPYVAHAAEVPFVLQDHGEPVAFRNIWVRRLER